MTLYHRDTTREAAWDRYFTAQATNPNLNNPTLRRPLSQEERIVRAAELADLAMIERDKRFPQRDVEA